MGVRFTALGVTGLLVAGTASVGRAATVALWEFENGTAGASVPHTGSDGAFSGTTPDVSGNGNDLSPFTAGGYAGYKYTTVTPFATVPQTGVADHFAVQNTGSYPALFSSPTGSSVAGGIDARTFQPAAWTVEVSYKPENNNAYRTVVGRDARNVGTNGALAEVYLQITPDNRAKIQYIDAAGVVHSAQSAAGLIIDGFSFNADPIGSTGEFYNLAAVSDGTTLSMYVDGLLAASTDMTGTSANTALGNGSLGDANNTVSGGDPWTAGEWSVGRGLYNGTHGDRAFGLIDDVRISNAALAPSQFLAPPVPEPATATIAGLAAVAGLSSRRRRR